VETIQVEDLRITHRLICEVILAETVSTESEAN